MYKKNYTPLFRPEGPGMSPPLGGVMSDRSIVFFVIVMSLLPALGVLMA